MHCRECADEVRRSAHSTSPLAPPPLPPPAARSRPQPPPQPPVPSRAPLGIARVLGSSPCVPSA
eukprot:scaffold24128_cov30-Phaeocystis_antarctica.AAC.1